MASIDRGTTHILSDRKWLRPSILAAAKTPEH